MSEPRVDAALGHAAELMTASLAADHALVADLLAGMDAPDLLDSVYGLLAVGVGVWEMVARQHGQDPRALWAWWLTKEQS